MIGRACPECGSVLGLALVDLFELQQHADQFGMDLMGGIDKLDAVSYWWCHRCHNGGAIVVEPDAAAEPVGQRRAPRSGMRRPTGPRRHGAA